MKERKMNNKGFSLVELIIVIAIMAILIVVLAPQYLKYVERSRNSTDLQNATEIVTAIQVYAADPDAATPFASGDTFTISITNPASATPISGTGTGATAVQAALTDAGITIGDIECSSRSRWSSYSIAGTVETNGSITFTYSDANFDAAMKGNSNS